MQMKKTKTTYLKWIGEKEVDWWQGFEADQRRGFEANCSLEILNKWVGWWVGDIKLRWTVTLRIESGWKW